MRERLLGAIATIAVERPRTVLLVAAALAVAGLAAASTLEIASSRFGLIDERGEVEARLRRYGVQGDLIAAITGDPEPARRAADALERRLREHAAVRRVLHRVDPATLRGRALYLVAPDALSALLEASRAGSPRTLAAILDEARRGLAGDERGATLDTLEDDPAPIDAEAGLSFLIALLEELERWRDDPRRVAIEPGAPLDDEGYLVSRDGRTRYVLVSPRGTTDRYEEMAPLVTDARRFGARLADVEVRFTGYPALAVDEVEAIRTGSAVTGIVSAILVVLIFAFGFRAPGHRVASVIVAGLPLAIGMAWAFGAIALAVGRLNLLTQAAAPLFVGLGIDFAIHLVAAYGHERRIHEHADAARNALTRAGPGVVTGALTTAAAFLTLAFADYDAIAELGFVAALGLVLVLLAILFVTPALLTVGAVRGWRALSIGAMDPSTGHEPARFAAAMSARPRLMIGVAAALTLVLAIGIPRLRFDADVEALMPADAESAVAARRMTEDGALSDELLISEHADIESLRDAAARMAALPTVGRVESAATFVAEDPEATRAIVASFEQRPREGEEGSAPHPPRGGSAALPAGVGGGDGEDGGSAATDAELAALVTEARRATDELRRLDVVGVADALDRLIEVATRLRAEGLPSAARLDAFDAALARSLDRARARVRSFDPAAPPPSLETLPPALADRFVSGERFALYVYPRGDVFEPGALDAFVRDVRSVDVDAVGYPTAFASFLRRMKTSLGLAALAALLVIGLGLALDFRRARDVGLALVPITLGALWLFGLMGWLGLDPNLANAAALPVVLGIGVDDGVHLIHRRRHHHATPDALSRVLRALVLTTATTVAGFGTLALAAHRGMQSFALVLVLGALACLAATLFVLPSLIRLTYRI